MKTGTKTKKHVVIIGAGLAGLTVAHELQKRGDVEITILEKDKRIGGRLHHFEHAGHGIDLGGYIIFPWYTEFLALVKELGLTDKLEPITDNPIFFELDGRGIFTDKPRFSLAARDLFALAKKSLRPLMKASDVGYPDLHAFNDKTIRDFVLGSIDASTPDAERLKTFFDMIAQGYCYGNADQWKAAFGAPLFRQTQLYGNVKKGSFFSCGTGIVPATIAANLSRTHTTIRLAEEVLSLSPHSVTTTKETIQADAVVLAQNVAPQLFADAFPQLNAPLASYTQFYVAVVDLGVAPTINGEAGWNGVFYDVDTTVPYHITSAVNLGPLFKDPAYTGLVTLNIQVNDAADTQGKEHAPLTSAQLKKALSQELALRFPEATQIRMLKSIYWPHAMPTANEQFVEQLRNLQGHNGFFTAGDYMGAPSMEATVRTGKRAAQAVYETLSATDL